MYTESKIIVRYVETDKAGIVHHSVYPIWYEVARTDFAKKAGMSYSQMENRGVLVPLVELNSKYIMPTEYDDELVIKTKIGKMTPARIVFEYEMYKNGKLINTGNTLHAITNKELKPINLKKVHPEIYDVLINMIERE